MPSKKPAILVHADQEIIDKIKIIAKENERSATKEIVHAIKNAIKKYEKENGEIILPQDIIKEVNEKQKEIEKQIDMKSISD